MANASFLPQYTPLYGGIQGCREEDEPSQALPRQLSRRESQAVTFVAEVLSVMSEFPAVLLPLPLGEVASRSDDGEGARRWPLHALSGAPAPALPKGEPRSKARC